MDRNREIEAFVRLLDIMDKLRERCPWDRKQTMETLRPLTIEETYELCDAILENDKFNISKELGDILLHIIFYAKIGSEEGAFDIVDVMNRLCDKLIFRHPHVFGETHVDGAEDVVKNWEQLKRKEKDGNKSVLSGVPKSLPSLVKAFRIQDKAKAVGFDWKERAEVWDKVKEEIGEFEMELRGNQSSAVNMEAEFGDILFSLVNVARLYDINPDTALEKSNRKFIDRFNYIEQQLLSSGKSFKDATLTEMDQIWNEAKTHICEEWQERTLLLLGEDKIQKLRSATVAVVGVGGVGGFAAEMIARAGVGKIILIDSDLVSITNKNRQLIALDSTIGKKKTEILSGRLKDINQSLEIIAIDQFLTEDNVSELMNHNIDYIIDAIDTLSPKIALIRYAVENSIPIVSSMGAGAKVDAMKVKIADLSKSCNCPLAYMLRKRLRKFGISKGLKVVFSEELPDTEAIVPIEEQNKKSMVGTISYLPAIFGILCAQESLSAICKNN